MSASLKAMRDRVRSASVLHAEDAVGSPITRRLQEASERASKGLEVVKSIGPTSADETFFQSMRLRLMGSSITKPMEQHGGVYSCIHAKAMSVAQTPFVVRLKDRPAAPAVKNGLAELLEDPNPLMDGSMFKYFVLAYMDLSGECVVAKEGADGQHLEDEKQLPSELWPLDGARFSIFVDPETKLINYWVLDMGGPGEVVYKPHEIIHCAYPNPHSPYRGLAPMSSAASALAADLQAIQYNRAVLENGGDPGGVIFSEKPLTGEQRKELESKWESRFAGASKRNRIAVLSGGLTYQQLAQTARDMQFMEGRKWNNHELLRIFRVPPAEAGFYEEVNYATADVESRRYWRRTLKPIMTMIESAFWTGLFSTVGGGRYKAYFDTSQVPELQTDLNDKIDVYERLLSNGWTPDQAAAASGITIPLNPWQRDQFKAGIEDSKPQPSLPSRASRPKPALSEGDGASSDTAPGAAEQIEPPTPSAEVSATNLPAIVRRTPEQCKKTAIDDSVSKSSSSKLNQLLRRNLLSMRAAALRNAGYPIGDVKKIVADVRRGALEAMARAVSSTAADAAAELGCEVPAGVADAEVSNSADRLVSAIDTIKAAINEQTLGFEPSEASAVLRRSFNDLVGRCSSVARHVIDSAVARVRFNVYKKLGVPALQWVDSTGSALDGEVVKLGMRFTNGMRYPHDPLVPAATCSGRVFPVTRLEEK